MKMLYYRDMERKQFTLIALAVLLLLPTGYVLGAWRWSSQNFTHVVVVAGTIDAKTNFIPAETFISAPSYDDIVITDNLIQLTENGGYYLWIILSPESDASDVYIRVMVSCPVGGRVTGAIETQTYSVGSGSVTPVLLDNIVCDGVDSVRIERGGDPRWVLGSSWGVEYRFIRVKLVFDNSLLGAGSYEYFVRVELGDTL